MSDRRRDKDFVGDMTDAMELILGYTKGLTYKSFVEDRKTCDAVVRNFEIIGEAAKNISSDIKTGNPDIPWKELAGLRDKLIHFYFGVDYRIVWNIIRKELPKVRKSIRAAIVEKK
jgi:uncharacterized protein with HEPN domain